VKALARSIADDAPSFDAHGRETLCVVATQNLGGTRYEVDGPVAEIDGTVDDGGDSEFEEL
jgi:hypothetical protein